MRQETDLRDLSLNILHNFWGVGAWHGVHLVDTHSIGVCTILVMSLIRVIGPLLTHPCMTHSHIPLAPVTVLISIHRASIRLLVLKDSCGAVPQVWNPGYSIPMHSSPHRLFWTYIAISQLCINDHLLQSFAFPGMSQNGLHSAPLLAVPWSRQCGRRGSQAAAASLRDRKPLYKNSSSRGMALTIFQ